MNAIVFRRKTKSILVGTLRELWNQYNFPGKKCLFRWCRVVLLLNRLLHPTVSNRRSEWTVSIKVFIHGLSGWKSHVELIAFAEGYVAALVKRRFSLPWYCGKLFRVNRLVVNARMFIKHFRLAVVMRNACSHSCSALSYESTDHYFMIISFLHNRNKEHDARWFFRTPMKEKNSSSGRKQ